MHPKYLDRQGLLALWRESLLAQQVLRNKTRGYKKHPQLLRFQKHKNPLSAIGFYLYQIYQEAKTRGYHFQYGKIACPQRKISPLDIRRGQIAFEFQHLLVKLRKRDKRLYEKYRKIRIILPHPLFRTVKGGLEFWEKV